MTPTAWLLLALTLVALLGASAARRALRRIPHPIGCHTYQGRLSQPHQRRIR